MTTTIRLEDDLANKIERLHRERALSFEELVHQALREGVARLESVDSRRAHTIPVRLGGCLVEDVDDVTKALAIAEGDGGFSRFQGLRWQNPLASR